MKNIEYLGILATIIGIISYLPVIENIYRTRKTNNFPYKTLFLAFLSNLIWLIYGIYQMTYANILSGILYFIIYLYILYVKY